MKLLETVERRLASPRQIIVLGFLASLLFVLWGPFINYAEAGYIDPWIYTGYFTNYTYLQHHHADAYYFSRLPWTIPGVIAFQLATPMVATILLNACLLAISSISLFFAIRWHYGVMPALLAALSLGGNPWFFSSINWDYPDGPAISFGFLAVAFAVKPHGSGTLNTTLMAAFLALSGFTNMSGAPMVLSVLVFPLWRSRRSLAALLRETVCIAGGVLAATLTLILLSKLVLGYWLFFMRQVNMALYELGTPGLLTKMWGSGEGFLPTAYRLFPIWFLLLLAPVVLLLARKRGVIAWPGYLALLLCTAIYSFQEFVLHGIVLHVAYHSIYLLVPQFLLAGVVMGELWGTDQARRHWLPAAGLALFATSMPWLGEAYWRELFGANLWGDMFVAAVVCLLLLIGWRMSPGAFRVPVMLVLLPLLFVGPSREIERYTFNHRKARSNFQTLMTLNEILKASMPVERRIAFWVDSSEVDRDLFASAQAMWTFGGFDFTGALQAPALDQVAEFLAPDVTLVHLTDHPEKIGERLKLLDARGVRYGNERRWSLRNSERTFYIAAQDILDASKAH